jgi:superfamily II DNA or RNA helicase
MKTLYEYQSSDKARIEEALTLYRSVLYQLPTGGGKSIVLTSLISDYRTENIVVLAHRNELTTQLRNHLSSMGISTGISTGNVKENLDSNIFITSIQSASSPQGLERLLGRKIDKIIIDEARNSRSKSYDKVIEAIMEANPDCQLIGVDATPFRKDKKRLDKHFQTMVVSTETVQSLTEKGFLQVCKTIVSPIDWDSLYEEVKEVAGDYQISSLSTYMRKPKYIEYVLGQYKTHGENRQAIVFAVDIQHSKDLYDAFENGGYKGLVDRIDSTMSYTQIQASFEKFRKGLIKLLINVEMITEGVDLPIAGCIIGARPTKSLTLYMQILGRGMRPDGIHDYFIFLDCCGWTEEYGVISAPKSWSLNPNINPNSGRTGNRLFGKNEKGDLIEDLTEYFGEIVEMTPEECLKHFVGNEEQALETNNQIDEKIAQQVLKAKDIIIKHKSTENFAFTMDMENHKSVNFTFTHLSEDKSKYSYRRNAVSVKFNVDRNGAISARISSDGGDYEQKKKDAYYETMMFCGTLAERFIKKDEIIAFQLNEIIGVIADLQKSKTDMDEFRKRKKEALLEGRLLIIDDLISQGATFQVPSEGIRFEDDALSYDKHHVKSMKVDNKKLFNKVAVDMVLTKHYRKYNSTTGKYDDTVEEITFRKERMKKEVFLDILDKGNWE